MNRVKMLAFLGIIFALAWMNCSKDNNPVGPGDKQNPPDVTIKTISVPQHMSESSDAHAKMSVNFIGMANSFSNLKQAFTPPSGLAKAAHTEDDPIWSKSWKYNGVTLTMSVYDHTDQTVWEIRLDGKDDEFEYKNWLFMKIEQSKDGKSGTMTVYKPVTTTIQAQWSWGSDSEGNYTIHYLLEEETEGMKIVITQKPDHSGLLKMLEKQNGNFVPNFESNWNSAGVGSWKEYSNNEIVDSGSWG
jgi:hypothetical protein